MTAIETIAANHIDRLRNPWQPIETAPKDGTPVLLWRKYDGSHSEYFVGWFDVPDGYECWRDQFAPIEGVTHWMPLPEPPQ